jgi:hypothetical protein
MDVDFDKLLQDVIENPELLLDSSVVSDEQVVEIQKRMNPYAKLSNGTTDGIAACSYTNLREDYIRRFTMTSMVSFLFQVLHEHETPKEQRIWIPSGGIQETFDLSKLKEKLSGLLSIVEEAESAENDLTSLKKESVMNDLLDQPVKDTTKEVYDLSQKKTGLLFTITHMLKELGLEADSRLVYTTKEAKKYPDIMDIIRNKKINEFEFPEHEFPEDKSKKIIQSFLENWLSFDPSVHVRNGINQDVIRKEIKELDGQTIVTDPDDPSHLTYEQLTKRVKPTDSNEKQMVEIITANKQTLNSTLNILRNANMHDTIRYITEDPERVERFMYYLMPVTSMVITPPQDTFHRWSYYTEVNYEELRTITECLYPDKPDLDFSIAIWTTFTGPDSNTQFEEYCQKYQDSMPSTMKAIELGKWTLLADFKENRKNVQFYNKNTDVLKKIIERHSSDKQIGSELMRNRVKQVKAHNIAQHGPDAPGLKTYKTTMSGEGKDLNAKGVERVISPEEMRRLEKAHGNIKAAKELEVLEEYEKLVQGFEEISKFRELTTEEKDKFARAKEYLAQAKEMINVPEDAIQVDVFSTDKDGKMNKSHFYTKCEEALAEEEKYKR